MAQADHDQLVQYIFPTERLPAHTQVGITRYPGAVPRSAGGGCRLGADKGSWGRY